MKTATIMMNEYQIKIITEALEFTEEYTEPEDVEETRLLINMFKDVQYDGTLNGFCS